MEVKYWAFAMVLVACGSEGGSTDQTGGSSVEQASEEAGAGSGGARAPTASTPLGADTGREGLADVPLTDLVDAGAPDAELEDLVDAGAPDAELEDLVDAGAPDAELEDLVDAGDVAGWDAGLGSLDFWGRSCAGLTCPGFACPIGNRCCDVETDVCSCSRFESSCMP